MSDHHEGNGMGVCGQCVNARGLGSRYNVFGPDAGASVVEALQNMTRLKTLNLQ